jgi:hypothetical protein
MPLPLLSCTPVSRVVNSLRKTDGMGAHAPSLTPIASIFLFNEPATQDTNNKTPARDKPSGLTDRRAGPKTETRKEISCVTVTASVN